MSDPFGCCICLQTLENPKALYCGHSYCSTPKDCLHRVLTSDTRRCSKCQTPIAARIRNENDLSVNYDLKTAIEVKFLKLIVRKVRKVFQRTIDYPD